MNRGKCMGTQNNTNSDIRSQIDGTAARQSNTDDVTQKLLSEISRNIEILARNSHNNNQGSTRSRMNDETQRQTRMSNLRVGRREQQKVKTGLDGFLDGIEDELFGDFKKSVKTSMTAFATNLSKELGVTKEGLAHEIGTQLSTAFKSTTIGANITSSLDKVSGGVSDIVDLGLNSLSTAVTTMKGEGLKAGLTAGMRTFTQGATASGATLAQAAATAGKGLLSLAPHALAAGAAVTIVGGIFKQLGKAGQALNEGFQELKEGVSSAAKRDVSSQRNLVELGKKRLQQDVDMLVTQPFENLKDASNSLCDAWEQSIATISATQGYSKESLQDLISSYADRLRKEGLSSVVSSADITTNLQRVLEAGLSGAAAEEFAYMATVLGEAVPTQDFFSYASTYASIAANAIKDGMNQNAALSLANYEMEQFASNVIYASRQLSGGFSTGLQNTAELFSDAFKIAQSAKTGDAATISGVLTSVAGVVGAIAPDLSNALVDAVVDAAIGGNKDSNVALRSLSGVNASNTEFLKALATQPKEIFSTLFKNLAYMQSSSADNFMEVAEGLADVFGVSMDSLARVDFSYLSDAIAQMNLNNNSLDENLAMLSDGQTKTSTEQLKIAEINRLMIEEGLSYVLDSEAGRAIQEHLWEEQMMMELQESTYAVELQGSAARFLEKISETVRAISTILNPIGALINTVSNISLTSQEVEANDAEVKQLLELVNIGRNNTKVFNQLVTRGEDHNLTESLVSQLGGVSARDELQQTISDKNAALEWGYLFDASELQQDIDRIYDLIDKGERLRNIQARSNISSMYQWGVVSKSLNTLVQKSSSKGAYYTEQVNQSLASQVDTRAQSNFQSFLDSMQSFVDDQKSYDDWLASSTSAGIKDVVAAAESYGVSEEMLRGKFQERQAAKAAEHEYQRQTTEDQFWKDSTDYFKNTAPTFHGQLLSIISKFYKKYESFYSDWVDYYIKHTAYSSETLDAYKVEQILNADKTATGDAVNALADALLSNAVDLKDPAVQTNVLLSQMLVTLNAILQQNTKTNNSVLPTSLSALGLGLVSNV